MGKCYVYSKTTTKQCSCKEIDYCSIECQKEDGHFFAYDNHSRRSDIQKL